MRNGQNKRMRGRNRKGGHHQNPLSRMYESNGPDVKIRGTASHVAEKYLQLARDAQSSGDPVAAENYYQHAEHYFRLIAVAQEQLRQSQPYYQQQQPSEMRGADEAYENGDNEQPHVGGEPFAPREPQPYYPREQQQHHHNQQQHFHPQQPQQQHFQPRQPQHSGPDNDGGVERLPSFITGNQPQHQQPQHGQPQHGQPQHGQSQHGQSQHGQSQHSHGRNGPHGQNGPNGYDGPDRFPLHRRRRRHRGGGPRDQGMDHSVQGDNDGQPSGSHSADE
jgi:hypothetical protein